MSGEMKRTPWGMGRVAFLANIDQFKGDVSQGWPMTQIYKNHQQNLGGISYAQFRYYVHKYIPLDCTQTTNKKRTNKKQSSLPAATFDSNTSKVKNFQPGPKVPDPDDLF